MRRKTIIACCVGITLFIGCNFLPQSSEFDDKATLEDVMEMPLPNYKIKRYVADPIIDCHGDFSDKIYIEFAMAISLIRYILNSIAFLHKHLLIV